MPRRDERMQSNAAPPVRIADIRLDDLETQDAVGRYLRSKMKKLDKALAQFSDITDGLLHLSWVNPTIYLTGEKATSGEEIRCSEGVVVYNYGSLKKSSMSDILGDASSGIVLGVEDSPFDVVASLLATRRPSSRQDGATLRGILNSHPETWGALRNVGSRTLIEVADSLAWLRGTHRKKIIWDLVPVLNDALAQDDVTRLEGVGILKLAVAQVGVWHSTETFEAVALWDDRTTRAAERRLGPAHRRLSLARRGMLLLKHLMNKVVAANEKR